MFEDGLKNEKESQVRVLDLAQIIVPQIVSPKTPDIKIPSTSVSPRHQPE